MQDFNTWKTLDDEIKHLIFKNGLDCEMIQQKCVGELNELCLKTSFGYETLFYGNGEASITVDVNGVDYEFVYVIDDYGNGPILTNF